MLIFRSMKDVIEIEEKERDDTCICSTVTDNNNHQTTMFYVRAHAYAKTTEVIAT